MQLRTGTLNRLPIVVCMVPVVLAVAWLVVELFSAARTVRRIMMEEEDQRRLLIRRVRREQKQSRRLRPTPSRSLSAGAKADEDPALPDLAYPPPRPESRPRLGAETRRRRGRGLRGELPPVTLASAAAAAMVTATTSSSAVNPPPPLAAPAFGYSSSADTDATQEDSSSRGGEDEKAAAAAAKEEEKGKDSWLRPPEVGEEEGFLSPPPFVPALAPRDSASASAATAAPTATVMLEKSPPRASRKRGDGGDKTSATRTSADMAARAVRMNFLLQAWIRLWLSMVFFSVAAGLFVLLLMLRFLGLSMQALPVTAVTSPVVAALVILALHSIIMLDGGGGGGVSGNGTRSRPWSVGRRPVIFLALLGVVLLIMKLSSIEHMTAGLKPSMIGLCFYRLGWTYVLVPVWIICALLEAVYLRALWENWTGESLTSVICGRAGGEGSIICCRSSCCWPGVDGSCKCPGGWRGGGGGSGVGPSGRLRYRFNARRRGEAEVSYTSCIRRRAALTPSQRAAAACLSAGVFCLSVAIVSVATRNQADDVSSWSIPITTLAAASGVAMVGAGLGRLAAAYCGEMRGVLPPLTKPLPLFYSEREGGWVVGPADPPTVPIFLLGDVTLRQEGVLSGLGGVEEEEEEEDDRWVRNI